jgi:hypothetical protein
VKTWKAVGNVPGTVWTKNLKLVVNSAPTQRKENFSSDRIDNCEGYGSVKPWKAVGNAN